MSNAIWRVETGGRTVIARGDTERGPEVILDEVPSITALLSRRGGLSDALSTGSVSKAPEGLTVLPPVDEQEVWASGVTFERSRSARKDEASNGSVYDDVYDAQRPELFFKSAGHRVRGHQDEVCIRGDSNWDVPEPEAGLVMDAFGDIVGYTIGNDMSSRSIEGENPLYLPQAKIYEGSCSIGPAIVTVTEAPKWEELEVHLEIQRSGATFYEDSVPLRQMRRKPEELRDWLFRSMKFPQGAILLTGTSIVPPMEFTLRAQDVVKINIDGVGTLENSVRVLEMAS